MTSSAPDSRLPGAHGSSSPLHKWMVVLLLVAVTAAVYAPIREHEFLHYDDHVYVTHNPNLRTPFGLESIARDFARPYEANWIPLTWISLHADYALYGPNAFAFHATSVLLHIASALLLLAALLRMTGALWPSAFVAAVFALHPLHVESVAWAAERKDTLSGLFWMAALYAYARYAELPSGRRYAAVLVAFLCSLLAKPVGVTLPFVLLLLDWWPLRRLGFDPGQIRFDPGALWRALREKLPLFAIVAAVSGVTFYVQQVAGSVALNVTLPLTMRVMNAIRSYAVYIGQSLWPVDLRFFYVYPAQSELPLQAAGGLALLAAVTIGILVGGRARLYLPVGWLWFLGVLFPMIGIVQVGMQAHADRYMYLPLIGLSLMPAWLAADWVAGRPRWRVPVAVVALAAVASAAVGSARQLPMWRDSRSLYSRAVEIDPDNFLGIYGLGGLEEVEGNQEAARALYVRATHVRPRWSMAQAAVGRLLHKMGEYDDAKIYFERAIALGPRTVSYKGDFGMLLFDMGLYEEAVEQLETTRSMLGRFQQVEVLERLADSHALLGHSGEAVENYERAVALQPGIVSLQLKRAHALLEGSRVAEARAAFEALRALAPDWADAAAGVGDAARAAGDGAAAVAAYRDALALGGALGAKRKLAWQLATDDDPAVRAPESVLREFAALPEQRRTRDIGWLDTAAAAAAQLGRFDDAIGWAEGALALAREKAFPIADDIAARLDGYREGRAFVAGQQAPAP